MPWHYYHGRVAVPLRSPARRHVQQLSRRRRGQLIPIVTSGWLQGRPSGGRASLALPVGVCQRVRGGSVADGMDGGSLMMVTRVAHAPMANEKPTEA